MGVGVGSLGGFVSKKGERFAEDLEPDAVVAVEYDERSGQFEVRLGRPIDRTVEGHAVHYKVRLTGRLSAGRIEQLAGVQVKKGLWLPVSAMQVDGDGVIFSVGPVRQRIAARAFEAR